MDRIRNHDQSRASSTGLQWTVITERTRAEFSAKGQEMQLGVGGCLEKCSSHLSPPRNIWLHYYKGVPYPDQKELFTDSVE